MKIFLSLYVAQVTLQSKSMGFVSRFARYIPLLSKVTTHLYSTCLTICGMIHVHRTNGARLFVCQRVILMVRGVFKSLTLSVINNNRRGFTWSMSNSSLEF